jgi:hypothetical protein
MEPDYRMWVRDEDEEFVEPTFVAILIDQGEKTGQGPNPQELLAMQGSASITE